ncbi:uncharacterized protein LOC125564402 [Nematostella vectensis]|nr:uncharacterized protein LOC116603715 isoform X2 [Nematostella vectensis]XP_032225148.2 uncharacterized protein LOC116607798 isoform X2 [Nematostella vectensis]XP_048584315.1 uncharacterized protein LOC125564402 [Nematostella vectensis]
MAEGRQRSRRIDYKALNNVSSADFNFDFQRKRKYKSGSKVYDVERIISQRITSRNGDKEYLVKWKNWPIWTSTWEPANHLTEALIRSYLFPVITPERLENASALFLEGITSILKSKAVKAVHSTEIRIDHDIVRYIFKGCGKLAADKKSMFYEKSDFKRFGLPVYWYYCLDEHGQGITVDFPIKIKTVLSYTKAYYIVSCGKLEKSPTSPVEKIVITLNRKACDQHNLFV